MTPNIILGAVVFIKKNLINPKGANHNKNRLLLSSSEVF